MPNTVNGLYVKYKITDELEIKSQKSTGAPSNIRGDELAELIVWGDYRWERLYGRYWNVDDISFRKHMDTYQKKLEYYIQQQIQGKDVDAIVEKLTVKYLQYQQKFKAYEYDRISVKTPKYTLAYNRTDKVGYGHYALNINNANIKKLNSNIKSQTDAFIKTNFNKTNQIFGFKKISTRQAKILGIPCKYEVIKTSFSDFERKYDQIENCTATIAGVDVDLYSKMGLPGERYIKEAVDVQKSYTINKNVFCSPSYVNVK